MRILMMTNTYFPIVGGLEQSIYSFSEEFKALGHEVLIVTPAFNGMPAEEPGIIRIPAIQKFSGTIFSVNFPISGLLTRYMKEFSPDMVHSHCPFFMGDFALRLSRQHAIPLVFTYHTMFEQYIHDWPVQNEGVKRFMVKLAAGYANLVDHVIAPSESVQEILLTRGVKTPIEVVPTGVDVKHFSKGNGKAFRERNQIPPDALVIGHAGRLAPEKNLEFLTNCLVELLKKDARVHVLIVGLGPSEKMIKDTFWQAGLEKRLHLTGVLHYQHLVDAYFAMDVFAFASLSETQGIVLIEAMAAGLPVVALDAPGAREVIEDHVNGRLLNEMDQQSFIDALLWVLRRSNEELQAIKQAARMTARKYPINSVAKRMLEIYEKIRSRKSISLGKKNSSQYLFLWRMKAEWDVYRNYIKSAVTSVFEGKFQETEPIKINDTTFDLTDADNVLLQAKREGENPVVLERRKLIRLSPRPGTRIEVVDSSDKENVGALQIADISKEGALFFSTQDILGEEFLSRIYRPKNASPFELTCKVKHKRKSENELYRVGVYFPDISESSKEKLSECIESPKINDMAKRS
ncbi:MAG: glycosyltransferase [Candidatus Omnitrophota bacterium]|nr:glycosyltransferase [Candidatus Omnitrophota bacterium]